MRKWINLVESTRWIDDMHRDFDWNKLFQNVETSKFILPQGTDLYHGTDGDWEPTAIKGPAWFGDREMATTYATSVFVHETPRIHHYRTTRPYRLLLLEGEIAERMLALMDGGEILMRDLAQAVIEHGWDGWHEADGEIMLGDPSGLAFVEPGIPETLVRDILAVVPQAKEIWFHGSRARGDHRPDSDWDIVVEVGSENRGPDYIKIVLALQGVAAKYPDFDIQPDVEPGHVLRIAKEEGKRLWARQSINESTQRAPKVVQRAARGDWPARLEGREVAEMIVFIEALSCEDPETIVGHFDSWWEEEAGEGDLEGNANWTEFYDGHSATLQTVEIAKIDLPEYGVAEYEQSAHYATLTSQAPPVILRGMTMMDGNHRVEAAKMRGETHILAYVISKGE